MSDDHEKPLTLDDILTVAGSIKVVPVSEKDWIMFAIGISGSAVILEYGGPHMGEDNQQCALAAELESLSDFEVMDSIEFKQAMPEAPGVYHWTGVFTWFTSRDWETGHVDDWHLIGDGEFVQMYPRQKISKDVTDAMMCCFGTKILYVDGVATDCKICSKGDG